MPRYNPRPDTQGISPRPCQNCGEPGHEHEKRKVYPDDSPPGRYKYEFWCPGTKPTEVDA